jgi:hypothetical protein
MGPCTGAGSASTDKCCGTCCYWQKLSTYEGICTSSECLSGMLDITEVRYICSGYTSVIPPYEPDSSSESDMQTASLDAGS